MRRPTYLEPIAYLVVGVAATRFFDAHAMFWVVLVVLVGSQTFKTFQERRRFRDDSRSE